MFLTNPDKYGLKSLVFEGSQRHPTDTETLLTHHLQLSYTQRLTSSVRTEKTHNFYAS